jgi:hypothetical protein
MDTDTITTGDCLDVLPTLPDGCAQLIYADPPFNIGLDYPGYDDNQPRDAYLDFTDRWLAAVARVLSPTGSLFVQIADEWAGYLQVRLDALGLHRQNTLIWEYGLGPHQSRKFGRNHQQVFYYAADRRRFTLNADAVRVPSARQTRYRDRRANPKGRVPGDVWHIPRDVRHLPRAAGALLPDAGESAGVAHPRGQQPRRAGAGPLRRHRDDASGGQAARPPLPGGRAMRGDGGTGPATAGGHAAGGQRLTPRPRAGRPAVAPRPAPSAPKGRPNAEPVLRDPGATGRATG